MVLSHAHSVGRRLIGGLTMSMRKFKYTDPDIDMTYMAYMGNGWNHEYKIDEIILYLGTVREEILSLQERVKELEDRYE